MWHDIEYSGDSNGFTLEEECRLLRKENKYLYDKIYELESKNKQLQEDLITADALYKLYYKTAHELRVKQNEDFYQSNQLPGL
jgi:hypothetical protein